MLNFFTRSATATMVMSMILAILALTCLSNAAVVPAQDQNVTVNATGAIQNATHELANTLSAIMNDPLGHKRPPPMNVSGAPPQIYDRNHTVHGHPLPYHGHNATDVNSTNFSDKDTTVAAKILMVPTTLSTVRMMPSAVVRDADFGNEYALNCNYDRAGTKWCMETVGWYCNGNGQKIRRDVYNPDGHNICGIYCECIRMARVAFDCPYKYAGLYCFESSGISKRDTSDAEVIDAPATADTTTNVEADSTTVSTELEADSATSSTDIEVASNTLSTVDIMSSVVSRDLDMAEKNEFALNCDYEKNTTMWCMTKVGWYCNANGIMIRRDIPDIDEYDICESICKCILVPKVTFMCPNTLNANAGVACFKSPGTKKVRDLGVIDGPATTDSDAGIENSAAADPTSGSEAVSTTVSTDIDIPSLITKDVDTAGTTELEAAQNTWALNCDTYDVHVDQCLVTYGYYCTTSGKLYHRHGSPIDPQKLCKQCKCVQMPKSAILCPGIDDIAILCT